MFFHFNLRLKQTLSAMFLRLFADLFVVDPPADPYNFHIITVRRKCNWEIIEHNLVLYNYDISCFSDVYLLFRSAKKRLGYLFIILKIYKLKHV